MPTGHPSPLRLRKSWSGHYGVPRAPTSSIVLITIVPGRIPLEAVRATGRRKLIICALWTEVCMAFTALDALRDGYDVYPVVDAVAGTSPEAKSIQYVMPGNCSRACSSWPAHSRGQPKARAAWSLMSAATAPLVKWTYSPQFIRRV